MYVHIQLQNQDSVRSLLKRTETEISARLTDALRKQEDPLQRQRLLVEEERLKYLNEEELVIQQLQCVENPNRNRNTETFWVSSTVQSRSTFFFTVLLDELNLHIISVHPSYIWHILQIQIAQTSLNSA